MQYNNIAERLKELRKKLELSQTDFGKRIGKNYHSVMRWELGKILPPANVVAHISELFNVNIDWLQNGNGDIFTTPQANMISENITEKYDTASSHEIKTPLLVSISENFDSSYRNHNMSITIPGLTPKDFAFKAPKCSSPPVSAGDIVIFEKCSSPDDNGLYIIKDKYNDITIRWFSQIKQIWCSKRPDYPDINMEETVVLGKINKIIREIPV